ncbi:hypothetical protein SUGI_0545760 [Cryptomeria japonica]|nr:hypothetical protein SUGI_0545760 [Cryptomeria japonica]
MEELGFSITQGYDLAETATVARDGLQMGEVLMRGASVMKGYLRNEVMTTSAHYWDHMITIEGPGQGSS